MVQYTKMENGVVSNLTAEEETARLQKEQDWIDGAVEREAIKVKQETDRDNANKKLKDLGLTDDEIKALKS
jgi:hypothetical protein